MSQTLAADATPIDGYEEIHGHEFEDHAPGMSAFHARTVTEAGIVLLASASGNFNPPHLNREFGERSQFGGGIAQAMVTASLISTVVDTEPPGPGGNYMSQDIRFTAPVRAGETVTARASGVEVDRERRRCRSSTDCALEGERVVTGEALLVVPSRERP